MIFLSFINIFLKEFDDYRDADEAIERMDGKSFEGQRLVVQRAGEKKSRYSSKGPQSNDKCFNCGKLGHW